MATLEVSPCRGRDIRGWCPDDIPPARKEILLGRACRAEEEGKRAQEESIICNDCEDKHEQKLEKLMSEVNEMDADDNQAGERNVAVA